MPSTTGTTKMPSTTGTTKLPSTTGTTKLPSTTGTTKLPSTTGTTKLPSTTGTTKMPSTTSTTKMPSTTGTTKMPSTTGTSTTQLPTTTTRQPSTTTMEKMASTATTTKLTSTTATLKILPTTIMTTKLPSTSTSTSTTLPSTTTPTKLPSTTSTTTKLPPTTATTKLPPTTTTITTTNKPSTTSSTKPSSTTATVKLPSTTTKQTTTELTTQGNKDKGTTKENPTKKNTVTQVSTTSSTLSSTTNKITSYSSTWSTIVIPTTQRQVASYSSPRDATISTTKSPEMMFNKTTAYVPPEKIAASLWYKDVPEEMNLCNKKPVDGIVPLQNGSLAVFRGHYYWLLNGTSSPSPQPRKISEGWHIPSPIDTVFSRCNCDGKTFFFKGPQYWRFTNDVMDTGYPKLIVKGFGGLNGKIMGALSVAPYRSRPESVHFFKEGGNVQQYVYKQKPKKCKKKVVTVNYPVYKPKTLVLRQRRFGRAIQSRQIFRTIRIRQYPVIRITHHSTGVLQPEVKITSYWRGFPKEFNSAISVPNEENGDGYDYYAFAKDNYYSLDVGSRIARPVTAQTGQTVSNAWYKCPAE
ncbi:proteoglycan 4 [Pantherophis guttatus]|uniref:Proteoglycan 4 n=1 Tax=Pantherophis guttatus TaxID=94885 RepID=A0ABM3ZB14_PANGU|nr:proteoglycan 4 [Pantherophis guttatus]